MMMMTVGNTTPYSVFVDTIRIFLRNSISLPTG
jgi:hypothetical protein